jgi:hypothetical protein
LTANNLIEFFKVLPVEEQCKFMQLAEKSFESKKLIFPKKKKEILTQSEAIKYLITKHFK